MIYGIDGGWWMVGILSIAFLCTWAYDAYKACKVRKKLKGGDCIDLTGLKKK